MPIFTDSTIFPTFQDLPPASSASSSNDQGERPWFLLAQIKEDMTITKPTAIVRDRSGAEFAVTFDDGDHRGVVGVPGLRLRKGHTLVVPRAARTDRGGEGKKAIVRVPAGRGADVRVVPGSLERVLELGEVVDGMGRIEAEEEGEDGRGKKKCAACGEAEREEEGERLMRCTGCGAAAYCGKACQVRGWSEIGHKANCRVIRAIKEIWP
ncbi:hypothetical protein F5Y05DRAFT_411200 [Hypoxylon sp. FL0543]|nr:hypothetical protein F5Y05DRAFT_411200 [Hypoxylon sp. FL0543]